MIKSQRSLSPHSHSIEGHRLYAIVQLTRLKLANWPIPKPPRCPMRLWLARDMMLGENHHCPAEASVRVNTASGLLGWTVGGTMSKDQNRRIQQRMRRYVSRDTIERRLERYTMGYEQLMRQSIPQARLLRYAGRS
jgi:hypothetical protein